MARATYYVTGTEVDRITTMASERNCSKSGLLRRLVDRAWAERAKALASSGDVASTRPEVIAEAHALALKKALS